MLDISQSNVFMSHGGVVDSDRVIYTPSDFAKSNLLFLQETGSLKALRVHESRRSELSSYLFFTVLSGKGELTVEGVTYNMKEGDCAFVDCMMSYKHRSSNDLWQLKWVHFNGPNMAGIYAKYRDRGGRVVFSPSPDDLEHISGTLNDIKSTSVSDSYIRDMELNEELTKLLTQIMRNSWSTEHHLSASKKRSDLQNVYDYLGTHYTENIKLDDLARMFFINKFYLTRIFKEQYGTTVNKHLTRLRITEAKKSLRFTDLSIEQISEKCGYNDANFFIRSFKRAEGMTPGEFRSKWRF